MERILLQDVVILVSHVFDADKPSNKHNLLIQADARVERILAPLGFTARTAEKVRAPFFVMSNRMRPLISCSDPTTLMVARNMADARNMRIDRAMKDLIVDVVVTPYQPHGEDSKVLTLLEVVLNAEDLCHCVEDYSPNRDLAGYSA